MKRLLLLGGVVALLAPAAARPVPCSPLTCSTSQFPLAHGTMLGVRLQPDAPLRVIDLRTGRTAWRLPGGVVVGGSLIHQDRSLLTWYDPARGTRTADAVLQAHGAFTLVGGSQDGRRAVLARTQTRSTTFAIVSPRAQRIVKLGGNAWAFDALNGEFLFLIRKVPLGYEVRLYDLATGVLQPQPLKDPGDRSVIQGLAFQRVSSPNGRYVFTLYVGADGSAMVHELDTAAGRAHCIDLPRSGDVGAAATWALAPDSDGSTVWAASAGYGRLVAIDTAAHVVRLHYAFARTRWNVAPGIAVLAPDGEHLALTDGRHTWLMTLANGRVLRGPDHVAIALGISPDERRLWVVGERSRVSSLRLRWVR